MATRLAELLACGEQSPCDVATLCARAQIATSHLTYPLSKERARILKKGYATRLGRMFVGTAEQTLASKQMSRFRGKVQLVLTSPPFPLNHKKAYGNLNGQAYVDWLAGFAVPLRDYLTTDGSIVIEIGNAWDAGLPTMSTLPIEALLAFKRAGGFHLCQEFIHFNPARLPNPVQWVNVERIRVKDAFTRLWWLAPTPRPKASNRNVLVPYSSAMKRLLKKQSYNAGKRPSEWVIGDRSFLKNNEGAIPANVLLPANVLPIANTSSVDSYSVAIRERGLPKHPARMPDDIAEFFIQFLTEPGDAVLDPFGGSNTTGAAAERLGRKWVAIEADERYANASRARFEETPAHRSASPSRTQKRAELHPELFG